MGVRRVITSEALQNTQVSSSSLTLRNPELCPACRLRGRVRDTRIEAGYRIRRYGCVVCERRWSSYETVLDPRKLRLKGR